MRASRCDQADHGSTQINAAVLRDICPLPSSADDEAAWVDRLLVVMSSLDKRAKDALLLSAHVVKP